MANMSDIAPRHAGLLFGLCNTFGSFAGILGVSGALSLRGLLSSMGWGFAGLAWKADAALLAQRAQRTRQIEVAASWTLGHLRLPALPPTPQCAASCWSAPARSPSSSRPPQRSMSWAQLCGMQPLVQTLSLTDRLAFCPRRQNAC